MPPSPRSELADVRVWARRVALRHRRVISALLAGAAGLVALHVLAPSPPASTTAVVAARDLDAGVRLDPGDIRLVRVAAALMPQRGALSEVAALGDVLAAPVRQGQVLTDRSVIGPGLLSGYADGMVAAPVRLDDADIAGLLRTGDRIDVFAAQADLSQPASLVVAGVQVLAVPAPTDDRGQQGAVVVLAATTDQAARLAQASATGPLAIAIRP